MGIYETCDNYSHKQITKITEWLDTNIGTEYEVSDSGQGVGLFYIVIFDLSLREVNEIRKAENSRSWLL